MQKPSILIVEDEAIVALDMKLQLQGLGYVVSAVADSSETAIDAVAQRPPQLILMDVRLRGPVDGIDTAAAIRRRHDIPIIFLTSHSDDDTVQRAALTAPYGYLTKPYQLKELRAGIEVALAKAAMERRLREADRWFAQTLRCVADGVILTDLGGRVRFINPAAERLTGWAQDDAAGRAIGEIVHFDPEPPASDGPQARVAAVLRSGRPTPVLHARRLIARNGVRHVVDDTAAPVDEADGGARLGAVLVLRDAAARVAQEALLRASDERFRKAFDHAPLGMALVSLGGEIIQVNDALCRLLGSSAEALKRQGHGSLTVDADREHEASRLHELFAAPRTVVQFERRYRRADSAAPVSALVSVSLLHEADGPTCYLYQVHDLTQQQAAAQQLAELAAERLRHQASELANQAKSEFLSRASHEMRTPLNAVIGFAQLLQMQTAAAPATTAAYAQHIRAAGEHLLALVTDLLDLNRVGQDRLALLLQPVALNAAIGEAMQLLGDLARMHGVDLDARAAADLRVLADPTRLRQVLLNLGSNAIRYNREGGRVTVHAHRTAAGRVAIEVDDTGIGMTAGQRERLFQPFERLGQEHSAIPGVGLGLVIARELTLKMGGTLDVSSQPGQGTRIVVELAAANGD